MDGDIDRGSAALSPSSLHKGSTTPSLLTPGRDTLFPAVLGWTHYQILIRVDDPDARSFYEIEAAREFWSSRDLERQIASLLFERLVKSRDKARVLALAKQGSEVMVPGDVIEDPLVLEFLDLPERHTWLERDLEQAIIDRIEDFLLELGKGFCFVARQKRLTPDGDHARGDGRRTLGHRRSRPRGGASRRPPERAPHAAHLDAVRRSRRARPECAHPGPLAALRLRPWARRHSGGDSIGPACMNSDYVRIIAASDEDRRGLFAATARRIGTTEMNVEKDFWVCWTLDTLFHRLPAGGPRLLFKGGTSLSKAFGLIDRLRGVNYFRVSATTILAGAGR